MIDRVKIQNYRCLREVSVPLRPLTVVIGPNNAGKTAFLSALNLPAFFSDPDGFPHLQRNDYWLGSDEHKPTVEVVYGSNGTASDEESGTVLNLLGNQGRKLLPVSFFGREGLNPSMQSAGLVERSGLARIDNDAGNLAGYLDALLRVDRKRFLKVVQALEKLLPGFADLHIATPDATKRRVDIEWANGYRMEAAQASYGVKLIIFFVALALHPAPPKLVLIDEPENGIHPSLLKEVVALLRGLTNGTFAGSPTQVVITTHSPYMLDYIDIATDQVLVSSHADDGSRRIEPICVDRIGDFLDEFMLGEIWLNRGEEGLIKK